MSTARLSHLPHSIDEKQLDAGDLLRRVRPIPPVCSDIRNPIFLQRYHYDAPYPGFSKFSFANVAIFQAV